MGFWDTYDSSGQYTPSSYRTPAQTGTAGAQTPASMTNASIQSLAKKPGDKGPNATGIHPADQFLQNATGGPSPIGGGIAIPPPMPPQDGAPVDEAGGQLVPAPHPSPVTMPPVHQPSADDMGSLAASVFQSPQDAPSGSPQSTPVSVPGREVPPPAPPTSATVNTEDLARSVFNSPTGKTTNTVMPGLQGAPVNSLQPTGSAYAPGSISSVPSAPITDANGLTLQPLAGGDVRSGKDDVIPPAATTPPPPVVPPPATSGGLPHASAPPPVVPGAATSDITNPPPSTKLRGSGKPPGDGSNSAGSLNDPYHIPATPYTQLNQIPEAQQKLAQYQQYFPKLTSDTLLQYYNLEGLTDANGKPLTEGLDLLDWIQRAHPELYDANTPGAKFFGRNGMSTYDQYITTDAQGNQVPVQRDWNAINAAVAARQAANDPDSLQNLQKALAGTVPGSPAYADLQKRIAAAQSAAQGGTPPPPVTPKPGDKPGAPPPPAPPPLPPAQPPHTPPAPIPPPAGGGATGDLPPLTGDPNPPPTTPPGTPPGGTPPAATPSSFDSTLTDLAQKLNEQKRNSLGDISRQVLGTQAYNHTLNTGWAPAGMTQELGKASTDADAKIADTMSSARVSQAVAQLQSQTAKYASDKSFDAEALRAQIEHQIATEGNLSAADIAKGHDAIQLAMANASNDTAVTLQKMKAASSWQEAQLQAQTAANVAAQNAAAAASAAGASAAASKYASDVAYQETLARIQAQHEQDTMNYNLGILGIGSQLQQGDNASINQILSIIAGLFGNNGIGGGVFVKP